MQSSLVCRYSHECSKLENPVDRVRFCICSKKKKRFYGCPFGYKRISKKGRRYVFGIIVELNDDFCQHS